jgi:hypothetical protein
MRGNVHHLNLTFRHSSSPERRPAPP